MTTPPAFKRSSQSGWSLTEVLAALALTAVVTGTAISRANTTDKSQRTQLITQQVLDVHSAASAYLTRNGAVPSATDLISAGLVPANIISGNSFRHAGRGAIQIVAVANAVGDGRVGFIVAVDGLDAIACRELASAAVEDLPGVAVIDAALHSTSIKSPLASANDGTVNKASEYQNRVASACPANQSGTYTVNITGV